MLAADSECPLPIPCTNLTHCARNQSTEWADLPGGFDGLPRELYTRLPAKTVAQLRAVFCLRATTETGAKHHTQEHDSQAFNAGGNGRRSEAEGTKTR